MKPVAALLLLAALVTGCAEINKPIGPNDPWRDTATSGRTGLPND